MKGCDELIAGTLAGMVAGALTSAEIATWNDAKRKLIELDRACDGALEYRARSLLADVADVPEAEEQLWVLLQAMVARDQDVAEEIAIAALESDATDEKQAFMDVLATIGGASAAAAVANALGGWDEAQDPEGWLRRRAIEILAELDARDRVGAIEAAIEDESATVREAAVNALLKLDARTSAPLLVARLPTEPSVGVVIVLAVTLAKWGEQSAVAELQALRDSTWADANPRLAAALDRALARLAQG